MKRIVAYLVLTAALQGAGCARYEAQPLKPQANEEAFAHRSLSDPNLLTFIADQHPTDRPHDMGWDAASLTLAAFYFQPDLTVARTQWTVAQAGVDQAAEYPNPTLGLAPAFNTSTPSGSGISPWILGLSLDIPIDWPAQRRARLAQARARVRMAWLDLIDQAWQVRGQVRTALLNLYRARQMRELWQQQIRLQMQQTELLKQQLNVGVVDRLAVQGSEQALRQMQQASLAAEQAEITALADLGLAIGIPSRVLKEASFDFRSFTRLPESLPSDAVQRQALMNRSDILRHLAAYEAAEAQIREEVARQRPDLFLGPAYEFDQDDHKWGLGAALTLPLFNRHQAAIETALRERQAAAEAFYAVQTRVLGELDRAVTAFDAAQRQYRLTQAAQASQIQQVTILEKQVQLGAMAPADLRKARQTVLETDQTQLEALVAAQKVLGQLEQQMQSPADLPSWRQALVINSKQSETTHEK